MNNTPSASALGILEGARRASEGMPRAAAPPDPEVVAIARRRRYSAGEKRALLAEADRCKAAGTLGAFLRSKRIYSSMLSSWRKQLEAADRMALAPKKRGPKPDPSARQIEQLNRENARLRRKLERAEIIIDAQKKLCVALGLPTVDETSEDE
jgi:transposase